MRTALDAAARALLAVTVVALVADALLGALTGVVSGVAAGGAAPPWWVAGHLPERARWVVFATLLVPLARRAVAGDDAVAHPTASGAWRAVGLAALLVPLLWIVAQWGVQAALITAGGQWEIDGLVFVSPDYYRRLFAGYVPWLLGGAAALVAGRHVV
jgi:hypothetical protein